MGDRCSVKIRCHKNTLPLFEESLGGMDLNINENNDGTVEGWFHEVNYGGQSELQDIAKRGIPFTGCNDAGDEYPPGRFCAVNGVYLEVEADSEGEPIIKTKGGKVDKASQKAVRKYMEHERFAESALLIPYEVNGPFEIIVKVTLQVDPDDPTKIFPMKELQDTAKEAVENALNLSENAGFSHTLANDVSIGVQSVEIMEES